MKKLFLLFLMTLLPMIASAYDAWVDGIYYYFNQTDKIATVTYRAYDSSGNKNAYSGSVSIPSTVDYNGETYSVTSIGHHAFMYCNNLTSVDIPSSVTSIEGYVFMGCNNLIYVDIPNSVTSIGEYVFENCI